MVLDWQVPRPYTVNGDWRRVGVELEFTGLPLAEVTQLVGDWANRPAVMDTAAEGHVDLPWGRLRTEIDWLYLKIVAEEQKIAPDTPAWLELLSQIAANIVIVPTEIVCPPIPLEEVSQLERLIHVLRAAGALGTGHSPLAAYGVHLNPELPSTQPDVIARYIQAFGLLQWWLVKACNLDFTRRISPYVDLYPEAYVLLTLQYDDNTSIAHMRQDYLEYNATRNRALDLWPLFAHFDNHWVQRQLNDDLIKARPTFHYRLPNCEIDRADWNLWQCWRTWQVVERLAAQPQKLTLLAEEFVLAQRPLRGAHKNNWVEFLEQWLNDQSLA